MRDHASIEQLVVLSNLESLNALLISQHMPQNQRLQLLNQTAITQMQSLLGLNALKQLNQNTAKLATRN